MLPAVVNSRSLYIELGGADKYSTKVYLNNIFYLSSTRVKGIQMYESMDRLHSVQDKT